MGVCGREAPAHPHFFLSPSSMGKGAGEWGEKARAGCLPAQMAAHSEPECDGHELPRASGSLFHKSETCPKGKPCRGDRALNLSLFGFYNRPDKIRLYKVEDWSFSNIIKITNENYTPGYWSNAFQIQLSTEYRFVLNKRILTIKYNFFYSRIKGEKSEPLFELIHRIGAIISL